MSSNRKRILLVGLVLIALFALIGTDKYISKQHGTVTVNLSLATKAETSNVSIKANDKSLSVTGLSNTYILHKGSYNLTINKQGYKQFKTSFNLTTGESIIVNGTLQLSSPPSSITIDELNIPGISSSNTAITGTTYFNENSWAVIGLSSSGSSAVVVAQYNAAAGKWFTVAGPGTSFTSSSIQTIPTQVKQYLLNNGFVDGS